MNKSCFICNQPAKRVCYHQNCNKNPFICSGTCLEGQNKAEIEHTHDGKKKFLPYEQVFAKVECIQDSVYLNEHINTMAKKIEMIIGDIHYVMKRYREELIKRELKLSKSVAEDVDSFILSEKQTKMTGKNIGNILAAKDYYNTDSIEQKGIQEVKKQMSDIIRKLQKMNLNEFLNFKLAEQKIKQAKVFLQKHLVKQSLELIQKAEKINPFNQKYKQKIQKCNNFMKNKLQYCKNFVQTGNHYRIGLKLYESQKYAEAIQQFNLGIALKNNESAFYNARGLAFYAIYQFKQAIDNYNIAISFNPQIMCFYHNRGFAYYSLFMNDQAMKDLNKFLEFDKTLAQPFYIRSQLFLGEMKFHQAIQDLSRAILINSNRSQLYDCRARCYKMTQQYYRSYQDISVLIERFKIQTQFLFYERALCSFYMFDYELAVDDFKKAIAICPREHYLRDHQLALACIEAEKTQGFKEKNYFMQIQSQPYPINK